MEIASLIISIIAVIVAGIAAWYTRGQKLAADNSVIEAKRSADAAHEAVRYQRADAERNRVVFRLDHASGQAYLLTNDGTDPAYDVDVDTAGMGIEPVTHFDVFEAGHSEQYLLAPTLDVTDTTVTVSWHHERDQSDDRRRVRLPVVER